MRELLWSPLCIQRFRLRIFKYPLLRGPIGLPTKVLFWKPICENSSKFPLPVAADCIGQSSSFSSMGMRSENVSPFIRRAVSLHYYNVDVHRLTIPVEYGNELQHYHLVRYNPIEAFRYIKFLPMKFRSHCDQKFHCNCGRQNPSRQQVVVRTY